jgi:hypothetical protein
VKKDEDRKMKQSRVISFLAVCAQRGDFFMSIYFFTAIIKGAIISKELEKRGI